MSLYTIVLRKVDTCCCKKVAWKLAKTVGKDSGCESRDLHCVYGQKDIHIQTGSLWITFFEECVPTVHSNVHPYLADLPVSSSLLPSALARVLGWWGVAFTSIPLRNAICHALGMQVEVWLVHKHPSHLEMQLKRSCLQKFVYTYASLSFPAL